MTPTPAPGEQYTIRRKFFKILGASFHVFDASGSVVAYCRQKAFRLREDIRLYTDESMSQELLTMRARSVIDFGVTFDVSLAGGETLGSLRRKGMRSILRDAWRVFGPDGRELATVQEDSTVMALLRRVHEAFALFSPQKFRVVAYDGRHLATFRTHFNPLVYRLGVAIHAEDEDVDELLLLAAACLIAAIEGRQD